MDSYLEQVNTEFINLKKYMESHEKKGCSIEDVLWYMIDTRDTIVWHPSYSFAGHTTSKGGYLSHRACARASDLAIKYPNLVEARPVGRIHVYRLKRENGREIKKFLGI